MKSPQWWIINTLALKSSEEYLGGPFPGAWVVLVSVYTGTVVQVNCRQINFIKTLNCMTLTVMKHLP